MRWFLIGCLLLGGLQLSLRAEERSPAVDKAVTRGVNYLLSQQDEAGAIVVADKAKPPTPKHRANAMTGLSCLAFMAVGHQPTDDTPAGQALSKALNYILDPKQQDATGYYGATDGGSAMYGHGIVTLMLAEMLGMGVDPRQDALIRERCQKAVDLIVRAQKAPGKGAAAKGGWRYGPTATDANLSVSVWQVMALRAAKNAGLTVPKETIEEAMDFIKRCYPSGRDKAGNLLVPKSGFGYVPGSGPSYSSAAAGLLALQVCGEYDAPELKGTTTWLRELGLKPQISFFYYGTYYYSQGMYQRGGDDANTARQLVEKLLLTEQKDDGTWPGTGPEAFSKVYSTALAIMSLSVRHHFMPIYQR